MSTNEYLKTGAVQLLEGRDGVVRHDEGDEGEPLDLLGHPVHRQRDLGERPERAEQRRQVLLGRRVRQVPHEQAPYVGVGAQFFKVGIYNMVTQNGNFQFCPWFTADTSLVLRPGSLNWPQTICSRAEKAGACNR